MKPVNLGGHRKQRSTQSDLFEKCLYRSECTHEKLMDFNKSLCFCCAATMNHFTHESYLRTCEFSIYQQGLQVRGVDSSWIST